MTAAREWFEEDYYEILGVSPDATQKEITKAYRVLAKQYHPDANSTDETAEARFKEITAAYEVLGDEEKRSEYDQIRMMLSQGYGQGYGPGPSGYGYTTTSYGDPSMGSSGDLGDLLSGLFSRVRSPGGADSFSPGAHAAPASLDIESRVSVTFYQAIEGTVVSVPYTDDGTHTKEVKVKVPACVNNGQKIKVSGRGRTYSGNTGNLIVTVEVGEHPWFTRKDTTLIVKVPISYPESMVGTNVKVPTLGAPVTVKVPPLTKSGTTVRVKERGVEKEGVKGDLLVTFDVIPSGELSDEEKNLYDQLVVQQSSNPRAKYGLEK